jgi:hypothetical protein
LIRVLYEGLVTGHDEQIKAGLLPVAEEQILADVYIQNGIYFSTYLHGCRGLIRMIGAVKCHTQPV